MLCFTLEVDKKKDNNLVILRYVQIEICANLSNGENFDPQK